MKHARLVFAVLLLLSGLVTCTLGALTLFAPESMAEGFGVTLTDTAGLDLLMAVLGAAVFSLGLIIFLAAWWSWRDRAEGRTLGLLSAVTLLLVAVAAWSLGGSTQVLLLDGLRGLLLLVVGLLWRPSVSG